MKSITSILYTASVVSGAAIFQHQFSLGEDIFSSPGTVAGRCEGYELPSVVCLNRYGSVLQEGFERKPRAIIGNGDTYPDTQSPNDPSLSNIENATFLVLDPKRAHELLGSRPQSDFMFEVERHSQNAVVYIPDTEELMFSCLKNRNLEQQYVKVTADTPSIYTKIADPPIYAPAGARYKDGLIYVSTIGGDTNIDGHEYRPGIYAIDPVTGKSKTVLNNYFGWYFNGIDDLDMDSDNNIWFTDNYYGRPTHVNDKAPQINRGTYRFNIDTGLATIVEDTLVEPNGIQFSTDESRLFMTDTGAGVTVIDPTLSPDEVPSTTYNITGVRTVYSYDVETTVDDYGEKSKRLINRTPIHYSMDYAADGLKISREGYLVTAAGKGITVLTQTGIPVMRVQTNFTLTNLGWAGRDMEELWAVGLGGVLRVRLGIKGPVPKTQTAAAGFTWFEPYGWSVLKA